MPTLQISKNLTRVRTTKRERESEFDIEDEDESIQEEEEGRDGGNEEVLVDVTDSPVIPAFCSSEEDEETLLDWLPYAPEVEESGWGQLEPALNELPSNKRACKDDGDKGEESTSALKRPHPLTVDVVLPEPVNEVVQVTETRWRRRREELIKKTRSKCVLCYSLSLSLSYYNCHQIL